jgi:hypothetical protein
MTALTHVAAAVAVAFLVGGPLNLPVQSPTPQRATPTVVSFIGCVERVMPAPRRASEPAPPQQAATFKLIDVQPDTGTQKVIESGAEYALVGSATIDIGKFQNQWVEVTGTVMAPRPATATTPPAGQKTPPSPLPTFSVASLKVVSTECK